MGKTFEPNSFARGILYRNDPTRSPYRQNDYIRRINCAKYEETKQKRLNQMLDELTKGNIYMKMKRRPKQT